MPPEPISLPPSAQPQLLLTLMSLSVFAVPTGDVADRLSVILTLVLTSVAFKFVMAQSLPKIPYNTALDWYVLVSFLILSFVVIENSFAAVLMNEATAAAVDRFTAFALVILFCAWHAGTFWYVRSVRGTFSYSAGPACGPEKRRRVTLSGKQLI